MNELNKKTTSIHSDSGSYFNHLMLDIETMGNESFSSIVSIGAVEFDINTGKTGKEFYTNVDLQSCIDLGLTIDDCKFQIGYCSEIWCYLNSRQPHKY